MLERFKTLLERFKTLQNKFKTLLIYYYTSWERYTIIPRFSALFVLVIYNFTFSGNEGNSETLNEQSEEIIDNTDYGSFWQRENVLDTVYTTKSCYVEVRLNEQKTYIIYKSGKIDTLLCSTGNEFVEKGQKTDPGIFTVKSKLPVLVSKQFNNTKCLNWVGFSFGVGFHALEKKNYYWSLGKRPSSHGCIRVSQESAQKLFDNVKIGTPVLIRHSNYSARIIKFVETIDMIDTLYPKRYYYSTLTDKLNNLYKSRYFYRGYPKIYLTEKYVGHEGIEVGEYDRVPRTQKIPLYYHGFPYNNIIADQTGISIEFGPNPIEPDTTNNKQGDLSNHTLIQR